MEDEEMEAISVSGVAFSRNEARVSITRMPDKPGIAVRFFEPVAAANIVVDLIIQNTSVDGQADITFTVPKGDLAKTMEIVREVAQELGAGEVMSDEEIAKVSIVGVGMRNNAGIASRMFNVLAEAGINIMMISTSEIKIS